MRDPLPQGPDDDLAGLLDRLLDRGIAAELELRIGVAGTDLVRLNLQLMAASEFRIAPPAPRENTETTALLSGGAASREDRR